MSVTTPCFRAKAFCFITEQCQCSLIEQGIVRSLWGPGCGLMTQVSSVLILEEYCTHNRTNSHTRYCSCNYSLVPRPLPPNLLDRLLPNCTPIHVITNTNKWVTQSHTFIPSCCKRGGNAGGQCLCTHKVQLETLIATAMSYRNETLQCL